MVIIHIFMKPKLSIIIPEYNIFTPTHFNYLYDLVRNISKDFDIFLIAEKGSGQPDFIAKNKFYLQKFQFVPLRMAENFILLLILRLAGYKDFYAHYSFLSSFNASLLVWFLGGRTFYWNCGLPWLYKRSFFRERFERLVYRIVTFLVTGTEGLKRKYAEYYQLPLSKIKVLPNWIDPARFRNQKSGIRNQELKKQLNISDDQKVLLFAHRLSKRKGAHHLPEILRGLADESVFLLIVGDGPGRGVLESKVKSHMLNVRFLGWVSNEELPNYYALADVFIMPSEEEGFPHVLLETMASGIPFVAFAVGGVKEIVPPELFSYLVPSGNTQVFIEKIRDLLHASQDNLKILRDSELNWVKRYDINLAARKFKNLFYV